MTQAIAVYTALFATFEPRFNYNSVCSNHEVLKSLPTLHTSSDSIAKFLEPIRTSKYVAWHWPKAAKAARPTYVLQEVNWENENRGGQVILETREVDFTKNGFGTSTWVLIHELSHLIELDQYGQKSVLDQSPCGHGPRHVSINLKLVRKFMGKAAADKLKAEFKAQSVDMA